MSPDLPYSQSHRVRAAPDEAERGTTLVVDSTLSDATQPATLRSYLNCTIFTMTKYQRGNVIIASPSGEFAVGRYRRILTFKSEAGDGVAANEVAVEFAYRQHLRSPLMYS